MFLIRWIRTLLSLPFRWLGGILGAFGMPVSAGFLKLAWRISGAGETGRSAMIQVRKYYGDGAARALALSETGKRQVECVSFAGLLAAGDGYMDDARRCLELCRELPAEPAGQVEMLEFYVASNSGDVELYRRTVDKLAGRNDLPPALTRHILHELMLRDLHAGRFDETARRAKHLLEVDEDVPARVTMWALMSRDGNAPAAAAQMEAVPPGQLLERLQWQYITCKALGRDDEAENYLAELRERDPDAARVAEDACRTGGEAP